MLIIFLELNFDVSGKLHGLEILVQMLLVMNSNVDVLFDVGVAIYVCGFLDIYSCGCFSMERRTYMSFDVNDK